LLLALFVALALWQLWIQVIAGPRLAASRFNPRHALAGARRGPILARDGTVLARTNAGRRIYPYGAGLAQTVGYASPRYGTSGLEDAADHILRADETSGDPQAPGGTLITTIDPALQKVLADALSAYPRGAGVVLDPRNGEVLAIASFPAYDANRIEAIFPALRRDTARSPLLNRAVDGLYPPGSTFKIVTAAAALEAGLINRDSTFDDPGTLAIGKFVVHDNESESTGTQDLSGAFALSSNVDFARIGLDLGVERWYEFAARFGLGDSLHFTLPAARDRIPPRESASRTILAQLAFGQAGLLVTPLRQALIAATIANGGVEPRPTLVRAYRTSEGRLISTPPAELARPLSAATADVVRDLMIAVVERGTGTAAALPGVTIAGKTGTATNPGGAPHAWFVGFAPADEPKVAFAIVVENGGYGGTVSAPIARKIVAAVHTQGK
jgi:peptidoglycan glycosyltransferase